MFVVVVVVVVVVVLFLILLSRILKIYCLSFGVWCFIINWKLTQ